MAQDGDIRISELSKGQLSPASVFVTADYVNGEYVTQNHLASEIAGKLFNSFAYTQELDTTDKKPIGAINEVADKLGVMLEGVLEAGQTSITFQNSHITSNSAIDVIADIGCTDIVMANGSVTLSFNKKKR